MLSWISNQTDLQLSVDDKLTIIESLAKINALSSAHAVANFRIPMPTHILCKIYITVFCSKNKNLANFYLHRLHENVCRHTEYFFPDQTDETQIQFEVSWVLSHFDNDHKLTFEHQAPPAIVQKWLNILTFVLTEKVDEISMLDQNEQFSALQIAIIEQNITMANGIARYAFVKPPKENMQRILLELLAEVGTPDICQPLWSLIYLGEEAYRSFFIKAAKKRLDLLNWFEHKAEFRFITCDTMVQALAETAHIETIDFLLRKIDHYPIYPKTLVHVMQELQKKKLLNKILYLRIERIFYSTYDKLNNIIINEILTLLSKCDDSEIALLFLKTILEIKPEKNVALFEFCYHASLTPLWIYLLGTLSTEETHAGLIEAAARHDTLLMTILMRMPEPTNEVMALAFKHADTQAHHFLNQYQVETLGEEIAKLAISVSDKSKHVTFAPKIKVCGKQDEDLSTSDKHKLAGYSVK